MTDKVQKIREEVERLRNELIQEREKSYGSDIDDACILELQNVLTYIDSLQEEPVSKDLEAEIERINKNNHFDFSDWKAIARHFANWQKEKNSVSSKDLEELIDTLSKRYPEVSFAKLSRIAVHVTKWQKKQDQETIELAEDHAMLAGIIKGKEEAIKKTIDFLNWIIGTGNSIIEEYKKYMNN